MTTPASGEITIKDIYNELRSPASGNPINAELDTELTRNLARDTTDPGTGLLTMSSLRNRSIIDSSAGTIYSYVAGAPFSTHNKVENTATINMDGTITLTRILTPRSGGVVTQTLTPLPKYVIDGLSGLDLSEDYTIDVTTSTIVGSGTSSGRISGTDITFGSESHTWSVYTTNSGAISWDITVTVKDAGATVGTIVINLTAELFV